MTDLQASLLLIGGAIVVGVITYNKWQEHKEKKNRRARIFFVA